MTGEHSGSLLLHQQPTTENHYILCRYTTINEASL